MTLEQCYAAMGGTYADVIGRLPSAEYDQLHAALNESRIQDAFRAAHTIKGVVSNLGMTELYAASSQLTELLRDGIQRDVTDALAELDASYQKTLNAIHQFRTDNGL